MLLSGREAFSPYFGGALARWTYEVYRRLAKEIDVTVFGFPTPSDRRYPLPHYSSPICHVCKIVGRVPIARRYEEALWLRALASRIDQADVVHIHNRPQWVNIVRKLGFRRTIILHLQNDHLCHWSAEMLERLAGELDAVVVCSSYLAQTFSSKSSRIASKTHVVFNGVDTRVFYPREEVREPQTILFVGRFDREKGVLQLVRAYANVIEQHPKARLVIGGTTGFGTHEATAYVREVHALARRLEPDHSVEFPGYIDHDRDLPGWFQKATVFVSPSLFQEPFGLVNAEAMACATPVVGSERGGIPEVLGETGRLVDPEDGQMLADAISLLLSRPDERAHLGSAALDRARALFDWPVIAKRWLAIVTQLVRGTGSVAQVGN